MEKQFKIAFPNASIATAIRVESLTDIESVVHQLGIKSHRPAIVIIGGASKLSQADFDRVRQLFVSVLAPLAQKWQAVVIDGGTDAGIMQLMGQARAEIGADFTLVGVAPRDLAVLPGGTPLGEAAPLEPNHTHFVLVPGTNWGDESAWIARLASTIAASASVTVLINGGEITWKDASESVQADRSVIVIAGSGRTADVLAAALLGSSTDARAEELIASGLVTAIDLSADENTLIDSIEEIFAAKEVICCKTRDRP